MIADYYQKQLFGFARLNGFTDSNVFNTWVEKFLLPALKSGLTVVMDNAAFHKSLKTKEILSEHGHELEFLPPLFSCPQHY